MLADVTAKARGKLPVVAPLALEAVKRIDAIFDLERDIINGLSAGERLAARRTRVASLVAELEEWMRTERAKPSRHSEVAKAMDYMLKRWTAFTRFLEDGRICLTNNAAERELRGIALGRNVAKPLIPKFASGNFSINPAFSARKGSHSAVCRSIPQRQPHGAPSLANQVLGKESQAILSIQDFAIRWPYPTSL